MDPADQPSIIINDLFRKESEISIVTIKKKIKTQTGQSVTDKEIIRIIEAMNNVEIVPNSKPQKARRKEATIQMFTE